MLDILEESFNIKISSSAAISNPVLPKRNHRTPTRMGLIGLTNRQRHDTTPQPLGLTKCGACSLTASVLSLPSAFGSRRILDMAQRNFPDRDKFPNLPASQIERQYTKDVISFKDIIRIQRASGQVIKNAKKLEATRNSAAVVQADPQSHFFVSDKDRFTATKQYIDDASLLHRSRLNNKIAKMIQRNKCSE